MKIKEEKITYGVRYGSPFLFSITIVNYCYPLPFSITLQFYKNCN